MPGILRCRRVSTLVLAVLAGSVIWVPLVVAQAAGDPFEQELALRRRIAEQPESPEAYQGLAGHLVSQQRADEAIAMLVSNGERWLGSGEPGKAVAVLSTALEYRPEALEVRALLGRAHAQNGDFAPAETALRQATEGGYREPATLAFFGAVLWENGRLEEAEPVYREAIERSGRAYFPVSQLGRLLLWQGRYAEAAELLGEASKRNPSDPILLFDLAEALRGSNQTEEAIATYRRVTLLAPALMKAHYGLAVLLTQIGDREASREVFTVYQRLYQEDQDRTRRNELDQGEIDRAWDLLEKGEAEAALSHLETLSESVEMLLIEAQAHAATGDRDAAIRSLERAVILDPGRAEVRRRLAEKRLEETEGE